MAKHWLDPALQPLAGTLNRVLALDPASASRLERLNGRSLAIRLSGLELTIYVLFKDGALALTAGQPSEDSIPDASVSGTPAALLALALDPQQGGEKVDFTGDLGLVRDLRNLLAKADLDWEEHIARVLGDLPAHQLGNAARRFLGWLRDSKQAAETGLADYLTEESQSLPTPTEADLFLSAVDTLREDTDRLQARVRRLEQQLSKQRDGT